MKSIILWGALFNALVFKMHALTIEVNLKNIPQFGNDFTV